MFWISIVFALAISYFVLVGAYRAINGEDAPFPWAWYFVAHIMLLSFWIGQIGEYMQ